MLEEKFAEGNGVRLHYVAAGAGKLILFAHGFPEFWRAWKKQLEEFGRDYLAVAPDLRGYNLSSKPAELAEYALPVLVEDVRALAAHLGSVGEKKFTLVGHDWGGVVAWAFAAAHPEMLEHLVVINAPHPAVFARELRENPAQQQASQYMLTFRSTQVENYMTANNCAVLVENILGEGLKRGYFCEEDKVAYIEAWSQPGALTGGLNYYRAAQMGPATGDAGEFTAAGVGDPADCVIKVPTLVIWGERDPYLLIGNLDGLEKFVPRLRVERIPEAGHWVVHEQTERVNKLIRKFISS